MTTERPEGGVPDRMRILVMDDEDPVRSVVCRMLERLGHDAVGARHGQEAIDVFAAAQREGRPFAVVLLDMTVPEGLGGAATLVALRSLDPHVVAVASTGYASEGGAESREEGFAAVLVKPYTAADLAAALARAAGQPRRDNSPLQAAEHGGRHR